MNTRHIFQFFQFLIQLHAARGDSFSPIQEVQEEKSSSPPPVRVRDPAEPLIMRTKIGKHIFSKKKIFFERKIFLGNVHDSVRKGDRNM